MKNKLLAFQVGVGVCIFQTIINDFYRVHILKKEVSKIKTQCQKK